MMSYRYDRQQKKQQWLMVAVVILLLVLFFTPIHRMIYRYMEKPLGVMRENTLGLEREGTLFFQSFFLRNNILRENNELKHENERLRIDNLRTEYLIQQLELQSDIFVDEYEQAYTIHRGGFGARDTLIIRLDSQSHVQSGDVVSAHKNVLLGTIDDIFDTTARVTLLSHPEIITTGVLYPHDVVVEMQGTGNGSFIIEAPRDIEVTEGDIVYSTMYPGKMIALVRRVEFDPRDPFKKVYLSYPLNIDNLSWLAVSKNALSKRE